MEAVAADSNIIWKKEFNTSIVIIDRQHRNLVDIINNLNEAHNQKQEKEILRETILKLVEYTKNHFGYEEKHMMQYSYLKLDEHKKQHAQFISKMVDILNTLKKQNYENLTADILEFLKNWTLNHILHDDKEYGNFYSKKTKSV